MKQKIDMNKFWKLYGFNRHQELDKASLGKIYNTIIIIFWLIIALFVFGIGYKIYDHHKYICLEYHYCKSWSPVPPARYNYYKHCDKKVLREDYEKYPKKYKIKCKCNE